MIAPLNKDSRVLIVGGGGTFGSSTALHLARRGYTNITAIDVHPCPSEWSAGYDLNKIIRTEYSDELYARLAAQAIEAWKSDDVFSSHFHQTGWVIAASDANSRTADELIRKAYEVLKRTDLADKIELLETPEAILKRAPHLQPAAKNIQDWYGLWNANNGWAMARDAVAAAGKQADLMGVKFISGDKGTMVSLVKDENGVVKGVLCKDGTVHEADRVILCTGAWSPSLVDLKDQCLSKCWTVGHIQLTPEEAAPLRGAPVVDHSDLGFFFEPSADNKIKLCNATPGYTHFQRLPSFSEKISVPSPVKNAIPKEAHDALRVFVDTVLPQFSDRPLIDEFVCWCTDHKDGGWLIGEIPGTEGLLLATGDSGMAFKFLPTIGAHIADALEGTLDEKRKNAWRWRPEIQGHEDESRPEGEVKDLVGLDGWPEAKS